MMSLPMSLVEFWRITPTFVFGVFRLFLAGKLEPVGARPAGPRRIGRPACHRRIGRGGARPVGHRRICSIPVRPCVACSVMISSDFSLISYTDNLVASSRLRRG